MKLYVCIRLGINVCLNGAILNSFELIISQKCMISVIIINHNEELQ